MNKYSSLDQIREAFNIDSHDLKLIRKKLNELRIKEHPDVNSGIINEKYYDLDEAVKFVDRRLKNENKELVVTNETLITLLKTMTETLVVDKVNSTEKSFEERIDNSLKNYQSRLTFPTITSTALFGVISFIFLFPKTIADNPLLENLINVKSELFLGVWFIFLTMSLILWVLKKKQESEVKKWLSRLKSKTERMELFESFIIELYLSKIDDPINQNDIISFSKKDFINYIARGSINKYYNPNVLSISLLEELIEFPINRAIEKNIIASQVGNNIDDDYFGVTPNFMGQLSKLANSKRFERLTRRTYYFYGK